MQPPEAALGPSGQLAHLPSASCLRGPQASLRSPRGLRGSGLLLLSMDSPSPSGPRCHGFHLPPDSLLNSGPSRVGFAVQHNCLLNKTRLLTHFPKPALRLPTESNGHCSPSHLHTPVGGCLDACLSTFGIHPEAGPFSPQAPALLPLTVEALTGRGADRDSSGLPTGLPASLILFSSLRPSDHFIN